MRTLAPLVVFVLASLAPAIASACPVCARDQGGTASLIALGAMILFPFAVAGTVTYVLRRGSAVDDGAPTADPERKIEDPA